MSDNSRANLKKLFSYVRALTERRFAAVQNYKNYPFWFRFSELPEHPQIALTAFSDSTEEPADPELILKVGKAEMPLPPAVPDDLIGWLKSSYNDPTAPLEYIENHEMPSSDPEKEAVSILRFEDEPRRVKALESYSAMRRSWAEKAAPVYKARKLYDTMYALYSELERNRDAMELMIGDGILETVLSDGTKICHPLVLERVSLGFDSSVPFFTVSDCEANPMLNTALLRSIDGIECGSLSDFSDKLEAELIHPFEGERFDSFLSALANSLSNDCEYIARDAVSDAKSAAKYIIRRDAVLFTRQRSSGYSAILDKIIADIDTAEELSPSLLSIVGQAESAAAVPQSAESSGQEAMEINGISADVLLEKAANREQLLIAKKLRDNPAVIVQGPPGTGKTHTISNIIGDLLARGQSVLVTSQTSKALDVLRDKISEPIRPLCVSVLDDNRKQLEESLRVINEMTSGNDIDSLDLEAARFEKERDSMISQLTSLKEQLVSLIEKQYVPFEIDGTAYTPKQAAKYIYSLGENAFIPDGVSPDTVLPLSEEQVNRLYRTNIEITPYEETLLSCGAPEASGFMPPSRFTQICSIIDPEKQASAGSESDQGSFWRKDTEREASALSDIASRLRGIGEALIAAEKNEPWKLSLAQAGAGSADRVLFERIAESTEKLREQAASQSLDIADSHPVVPEELINDASLEILKDIYHSLDTEKINFLTLTLHPKWNALLDRCRINGNEPRTKSEIKILGRYVALRNGRNKLVNRWQKAIGEIGGPKLSSDKPEDQAVMAWPVVTDWLNFYEKRWLTITEELKRMGFKWDQYVETIPIEARMSGEIASVKAMLAENSGNSLPEIIDREYARGDRNECIDALDHLSRQLLPYSDKYPEFEKMRTAVSSHDTEGYKQGYDAYDAVCLKRPVFEERAALLKGLREAAPLWADAISRREGVNGGASVPADVKEHWLRARLIGCLDASSAEDIIAVQKRIEELNSQLSAVTRELISRKAWSAQLVTMQDSGRKRALETWATLVKRVGKGTGKRAEQLLASGDLRRAMKECRKAVPVWIMPINAVAENFEPSNDKFDVLIIDEASQADLTALIALYLARKVIVVGDDKQVSPTPIGLELEAANKLRREFLEGVPAAAMYDELVSIYDLGKANYQPITLREHFRSASDIINFSNYYTYNGIISPLRDSSSLTLHPSTVAYHVENGAATGKKTNKPEAEAIASLIAACIEQPEYNGSTFGVITMLGDEQALIIDRILRQRLSENVYQKRQILCGNPSYFQGDERDVIFISMVDSSKESGGMLAVRREGYNELYAKRFNVAASRARDQMWVVYSMDPDTELKTDDIRLSLIRHALDPASTAAALEKKQPSALTEMEKAVSAVLSEAGYTVTPRHKVGSYIIGMTCEGAGGRVAIECDGDCERDNSAIEEELNKQSVLERLGWRFIRLRASDYYRSPRGFGTYVAEQVKSFGIKPSSVQTGTEENGLIARVTARAAEIREEWNSDCAEITGEPDAVPFVEVPQAGTAKVPAAEADAAEAAKTPGRPKKAKPKAKIKPETAASDSSEAPDAAETPETKDQ